MADTNDARSLHASQNDEIAALGRLVAERVEGATAARDAALAVLAADPGNAIALEELKAAIANELEWNKTVMRMTEATLSHNMQRQWDAVMAVDRNSVALVGPALRAGFLLNGGALIGVLSLIGSTVGKPGLPPGFPATIAPPLGWWIAGILAASIATAWAWVSQQMIGRGLIPKSGSPPPGWRWIALWFGLPALVGLASYGCFAWGAWLARAAILLQPASP